MVKYVWISVCGSAPEPAMEKDGKYYTIGCADPLPVGTFEVDDYYTVNVPSETPTARKKRWAKLPKTHGYVRKT